MKDLRSFLLKLLLGVSLCSSLMMHSAHGQQAEALDPSSIHFQAYFLEEKGRKLFKEKKYDEAIEKLGKANELYNSISIQYPSWSTRIVKRCLSRVGETVEAILNEKAKVAAKNTSLYPSGSGSLSDRAAERADKVLNNEKRLAEISNRAEELQRQIAEKEKLVSEKLKESAPRAELLKRISEQEEKLTSLEKAAKETEIQAEAKQKILTDRVLTLTTQLEAKEKIEQEVSAIKSRNLIAEISTKNAEIKKLNDHILRQRESSEKTQSALKEDLAKMREEMAAFQTASPETQQLTADLGKKEEEVSALEKSLASLQKEKDQLTLEKNSSQSALNKTKNTLHKREQEKVLLEKTLTRKTKDYNEKLKGFTKKISSIETEKTSLADVQKSLLEEIKKISATEENKTESATLEVTLAENVKKVETLTAEVEKLEKEKATLAEEKKKALVTLTEKEKVKDTQITKLINRLSNVERTLSLASSKEKSLLEKVSALTASLKTAETSQKETQATLTKAQTENTSLLAEIQSLKQERSILLTRPLRSEVETLRADIQASASEKTALSKNLTENEGKYYEAIDRIEKLQNELTTTRAATVKLEEVMKEEREIAHDVISAQRKQLGAQTEDLADLKRKLALEEANALKLNKLVDETKEQYSEVEMKYEGLLVEHEQLKTLLKEDKPIDQLKQENATMMREITMARRTLEKASKDSSTSKEDLQIAKKRLIVMRAELYKTKHSLELANLRGDKLAKGLQEAEENLQRAETSGDSPYSKEEVVMLKNLLQKHQSMQKNRRLARSLILEEVRRMGGEDTQILAALDLAEGSEIILSDNQKQLLANKNADGEFFSPERTSPEERKRAEAALNQRISIHDKLGRSAYEKGHYLAAEEFFQINLEDHPGHIPSMLNLGVSRLRRAETEGSKEEYLGAMNSFEDALAMRGEDGLPYALRMIGYAHYKLENYQEAVSYFQQSIEGDPLDANSHILLGNIMYEKKNLLAESERHFRKALSIDPTLADPQYNLACVLTDQGKHQEALKNYQKALMKGAMADPALEAALKKALPDAGFQ